MSEKTYCYTPSALLRLQRCLVNVDILKGKNHSAGVPGPNVTHQERCTLADPRLN